MNLRSYLSYFPHFQKGHASRWLKAAAAVLLLMQALLPQAIAQDMPTNTSFESAEPLEFENERLLVPSFHLANELWWSWKAPRHGLFTVTAPFAQVTVLTADQMVAGDGQPLSFAVEEDITYFIRAVANSQIEVTLRFDSPPNDRFSDAIELQESDTIKATIRGSTREPNEETLHLYGSVWWRWTPSRDGALQLPAFQVYHGDTLDTLQLAEREDELWAVKGGETYALAYLGTGKIEASVALQAAPPHASFAERLILGSPRVLEKYVSLPRRVGFQNPYVPATWWEWRAPAHGWLELERRGVLQVWRYLIDNEDQLILDESNEVVEGNRYAFEILNDSPVFNSESFFLRFIQRVEGNETEETAHEMPAGQSFTAGAVTNTGTLHWKWHATAPGVVNLGQWLISREPRALREIRARRFGQEEFQESDFLIVEEGETYEFVQTFLTSEEHVFNLEYYPLPTNDARSQATDLGNVTNTISHASWFGATREPDEPEDVLQSLWWTWTAPEEGAVWLNGDVFHSGPPVIYDDENNELITDGDVIERGPVVVRRGQRLAISLRTYSDESAFGSKLRLDFLPGEVNDDFDNAFDLDPDTTSYVPGVLSTREAGEPIHGEFDPSPDQTTSLWWRWRPDANYLVNVYANGSYSVYTGELVDTLTRVLPNDHFQYLMRAGTFYHIALTDIHSDFQAPAFLRLDTMLIPYRSFAARIPLSDATEIRRVPDLFAENPVGGDPLVDDTESFWWTWTAPEEMRVQIESGLSGVFNGTEFADLEPVPLLGEQPLLKPGAIPYKVFQAEAGVTYAISTAGELTWKTVPLSEVEYDEIGQARDLGEARQGVLSGTFRGTTASTWEKELLPDVDGGIVWWRWNSPRAGIMRLSHSQGIAVVQGDVTDPTRVPFDRINRTFPVNDGETYWIALGWRDPKESYSINFTLDSLYFEWAEQRIPPSPTRLRGIDWDPDNDGIPNLIEYAFNSDPMVADAALLQYSADGILTMPCNHFPLEVVVFVESSADLQEWTEGVEGSDYSLTETEDYWMLDFGIGESPKRYLRVGARLP